MPKVRIRIMPNEIISKERLAKVQEYWGTDPITVYGYDPKGFFLVWDQQIANWNFLNTDYCVPCE